MLATSTRKKYWVWRYHILRQLLTLLTVAMWCWLMTLHFSQLKRSFFCYLKYRIIIDAPLYSNLHFLTEFKKLTSLICDHNNITSSTFIPHMPNLELLWLNHCKVVIFVFVFNFFLSKHDCCRLQNCIRGHTGSNIPVLIWNIYHLWEIRQRRHI